MTIKLLIVGEGERDAACVPGIVAGIVARPIVEHEFEPWPRLHGKGFGRKLLYVIRQAIDRELQGVVATVDCDKHSKLSDLTESREQARHSGKFVPTAVGEPVPHLEAWLLDDPVAVRTALAMEPSTEIASPSKIKSPKDELNRLCEQSAGTKKEIEVLQAISCELSQARCIQRSTTGFDKFAVEVTREIKPLYGR